ncbi:hypothetical protein EVAR_73746_1 [Eumeta japonica]|uniref:Uncharacterized protein n=1 Tax=Eumeta variegata TaxID=151549 RepID=A0A4C1TLZ3_EUMVA|nr:hypothetical protein EVAR_73746_1 [Eumeta japonica]
MRRHSSLLSREFQRSSSVINLRKSVCSTSPVRRSNNEASDEEEEKSSPDMPSNDEVEIDKNTDAAPCEIPRTAVNIDDIIFEESDVEEEEEIYNCEDMDVESVYESVEEVSINISEKRCTLSDVTNMLKSTKLSSTKYSIQEKITNNSTAKITKDKDLRGKENFTNEGYTTSKENYGIDVTKKLNKRGQEKFAENSNQSIEEETLQEPRRYSNSGRNFDTNKSFPFNQNHGQISNNEVTLSSTTLVLNDMTLRNFKEAACSTPNSRQNSLEGTKLPTVKAQHLFRHHQPHQFVHHVFEPTDELSSISEMSGGI